MFEENTAEIIECAIGGRERRLNVQFSGTSSRMASALAGRGVRASASGHRVAAADREDLAGDLAGGAVGGDPGNGAGDVVGRGEAAKGDVLLQVVDLLFAEHGVLADGPEAGRADRVGAV